jgi:hypothetical protein
VLRLEVLDEEEEVVASHSIADRPRLVIGREPDVDIRVEDPRISRRHALFLSTERGFLAVALGDNPIRRNGERTPHCFLEDGDVFVLGQTALRLAGVPSAVQPTIVDGRDGDDSPHATIPESPSHPELNEGEPPSPELPPTRRKPGTVIVSAPAGVSPTAHDAAPAEASAPCPACGGQIVAGAAFCGHCGERLRRSRLGLVLSLLLLTLAVVGTGGAYFFWLR